MSVNEKMTAIADNIRKYTKDTNKLNLDQMAAAVDKVHEKGKREQYELFWDIYQNNGNRRIYTYAFSGYGFNADNFYPKHNIVFEGSNTNVFYSWNQFSDDKAILNLKERLEECGVVLDTSKATSITALFGYSSFTEIPTIDCNGLSGSSTQVFRRNYGHLKKIEKIRTNETVTYTQWFQDDTALEEITFEGFIGQNIDFSSCPLNKASIQNIFEHLSAETRGKSLHFGYYHIARLYESYDGNEDGDTSDEWLAFLASRPYWSIYLV